MKCTACPHYIKGECKKIEEGDMTELDTECLLRYLIIIVDTAIDMLEEGGEGDEWKR